MNDKIALQSLNKNPKYANKRNKNSVDEFLLYLSIFCEKENSEKTDEKNRQTAAIILVDLNPEHQQRCTCQLLLSCVTRPNLKIYH